MNTFYTAANASLRFLRKLAITTLLCHLAASTVAPSVVPPSEFQKALTAAIVNELI